MSSSKDTAPRYPGEEQWLTPGPGRATATLANSFGVRVPTSFEARPAIEPKSFGTFASHKENPYTGPQLLGTTFGSRAVYEDKSFTGPMFSGTPFGHPAVHPFAGPTSFGTSAAYEKETKSYTGLKSFGTTPVGSSFGHTAVHPFAGPTSFGTTPVQENPYARSETFGTPERQYTGSVFSGTPVTQESRPFDESKSIGTPTAHEDSPAAVKSAFETSSNLGEKSAVSAANRSFGSAIEPEGTKTPSTGVWGSPGKVFGNPAAQEVRLVVTGPSGISFGVPCSFNQESTVPSSDKTSGTPAVPDTKTESSIHTTLNPAAQEVRRIVTGASGISFGVPWSFDQEGTMPSNDNTFGTPAVPDTKTASSVHSTFAKRNESPAGSRTNNTPSSGIGSAYIDKHTGPAPFSGMRLGTATTLSEANPSAPAPFSGTVRLGSVTTVSEGNPRFAELWALMENSKTESPVAELGTSSVTKALGSPIVSDKKSQHDAPSGSDGFRKVLPTDGNSGSEPGLTTDEAGCSNDRTVGNKERWNK